MLALILALMIPPDAPPVIPANAPPVVAANDSATPNSCQCGDTCDCVDCQCADCPHRVVKESLTPADRLPRLRVTVWDQGCLRCEMFKSGAMAELGWTVGGPESQIEIVTVPGGEGAPPVPFFEYVTSDGVAASWAGYPSRDEFMSRLRRAMGLPFEPKVSTGGDSQGAARKPVSSSGVQDARLRSAPGYHSHRCNSCGTVWSHDGSGDHYREHSCPRCGRYQNVVYQGSQRGTYRSPAVMRRAYYGGCVGCR